MRTILVMNSKGGCGKTTLTTNIAAHFAAKNVKTAIMDYDPQGSSLNWLRARPAHLARIYGANAAPQRGTMIRSLQMSVPADTGLLLIDAPAGAKGLLMQEIVRRADTVIIPVGPSAIDIHATADFIKELLLVGRVRARNTKVAVVANRVRNSMPIYEPLERFLSSLSMPLLSRVSDSDAYIRAVERGLGIYDMEPANVEAELREFSPVVNWLGVSSSPVETDADRKVAVLSAGRRFTVV